MRKVALTKIVAAAVTTILVTTNILFPSYAQGNTVPSQKFNDQLSALRSVFYENRDLGPEYQYDNSWTCVAYAKRICYGVFNTKWSSWERYVRVPDNQNYDGVDADLSQLSIGDCLVFDRKDGSRHMIFVTGIDGNLIYFTDSNWTSVVNGYKPNTIRWNAKLSKETLLNDPDYYYHSYRHASNYTDIFPEQASYVEDWVWDSNSGFWKYQLDDGSFVRGWRLIDGFWYHFKPDTSLVHSCWYQINGEWYYFNSDGRMQTGWQNVDGKWYYLGEDGRLQDDPGQSDLRITGETKPDCIQKGHFFGLDGTIKSTSLKITKVYGAILRENGQPVQEITVNPNTTTYRLNNEIDNNLIFNWLEVGTYRYIITAADTSGTEKTLIDKRFKVVQ